MAHIVHCIANAEPGGLNKRASLSLGLSTGLRTPSPTNSATEKPFVWRMQQPQAATSQQQQQQRRQQAPSPLERQAQLLYSTTPTDATVSPLTLYQNDEEAAEHPDVAATLKTRITQHSIVRRRKISVPELGPMTTVQEVPMDSPTIPGRPPVHERSNSAPANDGRQHDYVPLASFLHMDADDQDQERLPASAGETLDSFPVGPRLPATTLPKELAPLVIPSNGRAKPPRLQTGRATAHTRSGSVPNEISTASKIGESPYMRTRFEGSVSVTDLRTPYAASASTTTTPAAGLATPISAPGMDFHRSSPKPWAEGRSTTPTTISRSMTPQSVGGQRAATPQGHRGGASESSSIMDRGRPSKRTNTRRNNASESRRRDASAEKSAERRAFEELPSGFRVKDVAQGIPHEELLALHNQAYNQAKHFEVLRKEDVDALSKELRRIDERTEYLRRTYTSLRAGRRNLHSRICQFLRSPRVAKFGCESISKQEEALAELDASIDDWVHKLEMSENRRTRVRQKLLEHVAAAAIMAVPGATTSTSESLQQIMGIAGSQTIRDMSTPPRSPTKQGPLMSSRTSSSSPSPQRVVAQVPSTILENPIVEEAEAQEATGPASLRRAEVESIRIYAGNDIATLLVDVEKEITRISREIADPLAGQESPHPRRTEFHRQQSHEALSGFADIQAATSDGGPKKTGRTDSPPPPPPPLKDYPRSNTPVLGHTQPRSALRT